MQRLQCTCIHSFVWVFSMYVPLITYMTWCKMKLHLRLWCASFSQNSYYEFLFVWLSSMMRDGHSASSPRWQRELQQPPPPRHAYKRLQESLKVGQQRENQLSTSTPNLKLFTKEFCLENLELHPGHSLSLIQTQRADLAKRTAPH